MYPLNLLCVEKIRFSVILVISDIYINSLHGGGYIMLLINLHYVELFQKGLIHVLLY